MSAKSDVHLAPRQRLARGLKYTAVGPVDITRGVVGLGVGSAKTAASTLRRSYQDGQLRKELAAAQETITHELAAAQETITHLPQLLQQQVRRPKRSRRPVILAAVGVVALAGGAVAFSIVRRTHAPEPSPLPPSVEVESRP
jgi:cell wall synthesis protein CwsA